MKISILKSEKKKSILVCKFEKVLNNKKCSNMQVLISLTLIIFVQSIIEGFACMFLLNNLIDFQYVLVLSVCKCRTKVYVLCML